MGEDENSVRVSLNEDEGNSYGVNFFFDLFDSTPRIPLGLRLNLAHSVQVGGVRRTPRCR
jgi:hypothetical protein